ncbi:MAG: Glycosylphosphatidylinositol (GPI) anchor assembly protein [Bathelium mastoideum]|nr:MAG: Glycosylphosphatidylinositol (GPI) anchor assembly protein [Bathelium mastoideum]
MSTKGTSRAPTTGFTTGPIEIRATDAARLYTHVHPALLLAGYFVQFRSIVADPVVALTSGLLPLSLLQISYLITCLPVAGTGSATPSSKSSPRKKTASGKDALTLGDRIVPAVISFILCFAFGTPVIAITLVLLGAPFTTHQAQTLLCAAHMSLLITAPLVYVRGVDAKIWQEIAALQVPLDEVFGSALGTLIGAWLGAVPIPLDWDREWQKWPVTIVTGAYLGCVVGKLACTYLFKGSRIKLN